MQMLVGRKRCTSSCKAFLRYDWHTCMMAASSLLIWPACAAAFLNSSTVPKASSDISAVGLVATFGASPRQAIKQCHRALPAIPILPYRSSYANLGVPIVPACCLASDSEHVAESEFAWSNVVKCGRLLMALLCSCPRASNKAANAILRARKRQSAFIDCALQAQLKHSTPCSDQRKYTVRFRGD